MSAEPITVTELDAETIEELQPPCSAMSRSSAGLNPCYKAAVWITTVKCDCHGQCRPLMCGEHLAQTVDGRVTCQGGKPVRLTACEALR